jgi:psiF repeat
LTQLCNYWGQQLATDRVGFCFRHQEEYIMSQRALRTVFLRTVAIAALSMAAGSMALADDTPPPANPARGGRHDNPAWAACKKQADDQKLQPGDARHEFMKNCLKSAKSSGTPAATS